MGSGAQKGERDEPDMVGFWAGSHRGRKSKREAVHGKYLHKTTAKNVLGPPDLGALKNRRDRLFLL